VGPTAGLDGMEKCMQISKELLSIVDGKHSKGIRYSKTFGLLASHYLRKASNQCLFSICITHN
jgi:hypothetical protein